VLPSRKLISDDGPTSVVGRSCMRVHPSPGPEPMDHSRASHQPEGRSRALYFTKHLVPYGVERYALEPCRALNGRVAPSILALRGAAFEQEFVALNVPVRLCPPGLDTPLRQRLPVGPGLFKAALAAIREFGPDTICPQHIPRVSQLAARICLSLDVPLVVHLLGAYGRAGRLPSKSRPWYRGLVKPARALLGRWIEARPIRALRSLHQRGRSRVIAVSHGVGRTFTDGTGTPTGPCAVPRCCASRQQTSSAGLPLPRRRAVTRKSYHGAGG